MKRKGVSITCCLAVVSVLFSGCASGNQEATIQSYEAVISSLEADKSSMAAEAESMAARIEKLESVPTVPAGMSDEMYGYGVTVLKSIDAYLSDTQTADDCLAELDFVDALFLANKTGLGKIDKECYDNLVYCFITLKKIAKEDYSDYTLEQLLTALPIQRDNLATCLGLE